jgi:4-amino-4-deoxy-L-arabinose transferase-like glycosyltransferase
MQRFVDLTKKYKYFLAMLFICALSFAFNFYAISNNGTGNEYYAACIKSMTQNFKNFFFVSFDPAGMVSVDKPPLGLWTQAISVLIFGYHGWAMLLPQALAGTASCVMLYLLTAKHFGKPAGLLSSLFFALTPAVVVVSRNNTMDMQLIFVLLVSAWFLFHSIETGKWRYLFLVAVFVGLGFNIKMLQAYMILPAIAIVYLLFAKEKWGKRLLAGMLSMVILLGVSFTWVLVVEFYPAENRPYVDSTRTNSMLELITGHNGTERLFGESKGGGMGNGTRMPSDSRADSSSSYGKPDGNRMPGEQDGNNPDGFGAREEDDSRRADHPDSGAGAGGGSEIGNASPLRLWSSNLYGQGSWFLLFALCSIPLCLRKKKSMRQGVIVFWAVWLIAMAVFFSFAGFYHRYYLCMLAPPIAVLSGIGIFEMYKGCKEKKEKKTDYLRPMLLLTAFLANLALQIVCVFRYSELTMWMLPALAGTAVTGIFLFAVFLLKTKPVFLRTATALLILSSLIATTYWAITPVMRSPNTTMPYAGPELLQNSENKAGGAFDSRGETKASGLEQYLVKHYKAGSFLVTAQRSNTVAQYIINTGLPCYAYGGFLGSDKSLTADKLKELVSEGKITYFLLSGQGEQNDEIASYVKQNAKEVAADEYTPESKSGNTGIPGRGMGGTLYLFQS